MWLSVCLSIALGSGAVAVYLCCGELLKHRMRIRNRQQMHARLGGLGGLGRLPLSAGSTTTQSAGTVASDTAALNAAARDTAARDTAALGTADMPSSRAAFSTGRARIPLLGFLQARLSQRQAENRMQANYERDLPAMLEVIALGMRAGMGFDQAFELYTCRFETPLARLCKGPLEIWQRGLVSREAGMRELGQQVATPFFGRFVATVLRSLRYGAPMTRLLGDLASEARKDYRAKREALVAKAPVKMLLPTGALILPAMLLLVMGPIVLDLMERIG